MANVRLSRCSGRDKMISTNSSWASTRVLLTHTCRTSSLTRSTTPRLCRLSKKPNSKSKPSTSSSTRPSNATITPTPTSATSFRPSSSPTLNARESRGRSRMKNASTLKPPEKSSRTQWRRRVASSRGKTLKEGTSKLTTTTRSMKRKSDQRPSSL